MKRGLLLLLLGPLAASGQPTVPPAERISVERAVEIALTQNRRLLQARLGGASARDREAQVRSYLFPQISANGVGARLLSPLDFRFRAGTFGDYPGTGLIPATDATLRAEARTVATGTVTLTQPISQLFKISHRADIATLARQGEDEKMRGTRHLVTQSVRQACLALLRTQSELSALAEAKALLREIKANVDEGVAVKTLLREDALAANARLAEVETKESQLSSLQISQAEQLNQLLGRSLTTPIEIEPTLAVLPEEGSLADARSQALANRPEIRQARLELEQAKHGVKASRAERFPEAGLVVSQQWLGNLRPLPKSVGYAGVAVQWDVFDGGRKKSEGMIAARGVEQAKLNIEEVSDQVSIEVGMAFRGLALSRAALRSADLALAADQEKLRVLVAKKRSEFASTRELLEQQAAFEASRSRRQNAYYDTWLARAAFEKALGND